MKNIFLILFCLSNFFVFAQKTDSSRVLPKNAIYIELLGNAGIGSLNYERIFWQKNNWRVAGRVGILMLPTLEKSARAYDDFSKTLAFEGLIFYGKRHHFLEFGVGLTGLFSKSVQETNKWNTLLLRLGYRYQAEKGFLFRAGAFLVAKPSFNNNQILPIPWLGFSFGKSF